MRLGLNGPNLCRFRAANSPTLIQAAPMWHKHNVGLRLHVVLSIFLNRNFGVVLPSVGVIGLYVVRCPPGHFEIQVSSAAKLSAENWLVLSLVQPLWQDVATPPRLAAGVPNFANKKFGVVLPTRTVIVLCPIRPPCALEHRRPHPLR
jgi:hypothetical protein